jgi:hypothetical protein
MSRGTLRPRRKLQLRAARQVRLRSPVRPSQRLRRHWRRGHRQTNLARLQRNPDRMRASRSQPHPAAGTYRIRRTPLSCDRRRKECTRSPRHPRRCRPSAPARCSARRRRGPGCRLGSQRDRRIRGDSRSTTSHQLVTAQFPRKVGVSRANEHAHFERCPRPAPDDDDPPVPVDQHAAISSKSIASEPHDYL